MKKLISLLALGALAVSAQAASFTFKPSNSNLSDLDHYKAYSWGIGYSTDTTANKAAMNGLRSRFTAGEEILAAEIKISKIYNWDNNANVLHISLLDNARKGVVISADNQTPSDFFEDGAGPNVNLTNWVDVDGGNPALAADFFYSFDSGEIALLTTYLNNVTASNKAVFGLGFDPDCHYYNRGVQFTITTGVRDVPEGGMTVALVGLGLAALVGIRRRIRS